MKGSLFIIVLLFTCYPTVVNAQENQEDHLPLAQFIEKIRETIKSGTLQLDAIAIDKVADDVKENTIYAALPASLDWSCGYATIYIGSRKKDFPRDHFLKRCLTHISLSREKLKVCGIKGYIVLLTPDYYVSFANWETQELLLASGKTEESKAVVADGAQFMDNVLWSDARQIPQDYHQKLREALNKLAK